ncbi:glycosyltransferase [Cecembia rubra]|uniref:GT2 family glycosyltransferase n=1 Tax=Cecembia rubra TaxID=1485585 RepID=A0A2P8DWF9_9BACT|nr:glycosyltransferase [Cecembia rubra]PSL01507.1 GT2 family glycosyltransferase [Cecembia rubra]
MLFSIIIPVYNRPQEIKELLGSLVQQTLKDFEVIIVEDGSTFTCEDAVGVYSHELKIHYYSISNVGQGFARNFGMERANGDYFILFDSDCIIPPQYLEVLKATIEKRKLDAHGGPDAADKDFSSFQKAINYSMTSFLTTGGIRGKTKDPSKYQARGYNMGLSNKAFKSTKGFIDPNRAEDIELSIRLKKLGFRLELVEEAYVYHKRRNTWESFLAQSFSFGQNRVHVSRFHPEAIKLVHWMPSLFLIGWVLTLLFFIMGISLFRWGLNLYVIWILLIFLDSSIKEKSIAVGALAVCTSFGQLSAYGLGLITAFIRKKFLKKT